MSQSTQCLGSLVPLTMFQYIDKLVWFSTSKKGECQVINALRLIDKCALSTLTLAFSIKILDIVCFVYDTVCELKGRMNTIALGALCIGRKINTICGFWSNRTLLYFPLSVRPFVRHRRDISTFLDILTVYTMKTIYFLNAYHLDW